MKMKSLGALAAASTLLLAGCASGGTAESPDETETAAPLVEVQETNDPVTITLASWGSSPSETASLEEAIQSFKDAYPYIDVELIVHADHGKDMAAKFAARNPPDVFYLDAGVAQEWASQGVLYGLRSSIEASDFNFEGFNESFVRPFTGADGEIYGLPKDANPLVLEGNSVLMAQAGIDSLPATVAEFDAQAELLLAEGIVPMCVDADINRLGAFFISFGGGLATDDWSASKLTSAGTEAAMTWAMDNYKKGVFQMPSQLSAGWAGEAFGLGKCAYTMEGAWIDPYLRDSFPEVYEVMVKSELPVKDTAGSLAFTAAYAIGKDSTNKEAAWKFVSFMTGPEGMEIWTSKGVAIPSRTDVATPSGYEVNGDAVANSFTKTPPFIPGWGDVVSAFNNRASQIVLEGYDDPFAAAKEVLAAAESAWPGN